MLTSKDELVELFKYATKQTHLLFDGERYDQIDGVALASPLAPILVNLYMGYHEKKWLPEFEGPNFPFYQRYMYVDDLFCMFYNESELDTFHDYLNTRHLVYG